MTKFFVCTIIKLWKRLRNLRHTQTSSGLWLCIRSFHMYCHHQTTCKLWDYKKDWECTQIFKGHSHYVMQVAFNPKETNAFASVSLDCETMIWNVGSPNPKIVLEGHSKGINAVDFFVVRDKPYLVTGSDDQTAKVWDYQAGTCLQTLEGHTNNITTVCVHPDAPIIITGSEDDTVRMWNATTYGLENTLKYKFGRVWTIGCLRSSPQIVVGCDQGTIIGKFICSRSWDSVNLSVPHVENLSNE